MDQREELSIHIIQDIADREGVDPVNLNAPFSEAIDPDALDALVAGSSGGLNVEFSYHGYTVTVAKDTGETTVCVERANTGVGSRATVESKAE